MLLDYAYVIGLLCYTVTVDGPSVSNSLFCQQNNIVVNQCTSVEHSVILDYKCNVFDNVTSRIWVLSFTGTSSKVRKTNHLYGHQVLQDSKDAADNGLMSIYGVWKDLFCL